MLNERFVLIAGNYARAYKRREAITAAHIPLAEIEDPRRTVEDFRKWPLFCVGDSETRDK